MKLKDRVKPISYLKANASEIIRELGEGADPLVVTVNGEAKAILQDIGDYEATQETLAMLKIAAMGDADIRAGRVKPAAEAFKLIRKRLRG